MRKRLWAEDPMRDVPKIVKPERLPRPFHRDEMQRLMALELPAPERVVRALLAYTGLRVSPICNLTIADVSFAKQVINGVEVPGAIRSLGKGAKPLVTPMAPPLHEVLYNHVLQSTDLKGHSPRWPRSRGQPSRPQDHGCPDSSAGIVSFPVASARSKHV
jgi:integrase